MLAYHLGAGWLPGGFLGVDVFFALSGFLITTLLLTSAGQEGRIELARFWAGRIRRLLPAALLMVAVVAVVGAATLPRSRLGALRADGVWTLLQGANWRFVFSDQPYLNAFAPPSPLRHAWSLAVEEQFYLLWPALLAVVYRLRTWRTPLLVITVGLAVGSAALMRHLYAAPDPSRAYYGTDTRAHALLAGAALAIVLLGPGRTLVARWLRWCAPLAGLTLVVAFALVHDSWQWYYRGVAAALGLVAAVLVAAVAVAPDGVAGRLLSRQPLPWVGRLSYALYLWHWPVYCWLDSAPVLTTGALGAVPFASPVAKLGLTAILATTSYYLVERPLRGSRAGRPVRAWWLRSGSVATGPAGARRRAWPAALLVPAAAVAGVLGLVLVATVRATPPMTLATSAQGSAPRPWVAAATPTAPRLATVGDSVAESLAPGFVAIARARGWGYVDAAVSACSVAALLLVEPDGRPWPTGRRCPQTVPAMQNALVQRYDPTLILVHSRWETYPVRRADGVIVRPGSAAHLNYVRDQLRAALRRLTAGRAHVVLIDSIPMADSLCRRLGHSLATCRAQVHDPELAQYDRLRATTAAEFAGRVDVLAVPDLLCPGGRCTDRVAGRTPRPDGLHFSPEGAAWIAPAIVRRVASRGPL